LQVDLQAEKKYTHKQAITKQTKIFSLQTDLQAENNNHKQAITKQTKIFFSQQ
jgi:hypothetical protein